MIRVIAVYRAEPDAARYEQHAELCRRVPGSTFRHGKVLRTLSGEPELHYYDVLTHNLAAVAVVDVLAHFPAFPVRNFDARYLVVQPVRAQVRRVIAKRGALAGEIGIRVHRDAAAEAPHLRRRRNRDE